MVVIFDFEEGGDGKREEKCFIGIFIINLFIFVFGDEIYVIYLFLRILK